MFTTKEVLNESVQHHPKIVFFTGAGVSAESGLSAAKGLPTGLNDR